MRSLFKRRQKTLRVLVIGKNPTVREALIERYNKTVRPRIFVGYGAEEIQKVDNVESAIRRLEDGPDVDVIVYREDFSETELDRLTDYLTSRGMHPSKYGLIPAVKV